MPEISVVIFNETGGPYDFWRAPDGTVQMGNNQSYWEIGKDHPDCEFYAWIADRRARFRGVFDDELGVIRNEFRQWQRGWLPWLWYRLTNRRRSGWVKSISESD